MAILRSGLRTAAVAALGVTMASMAAVHPAGAQQGLEYEVKAAFVYNFIKFVEWPPDTIEGDAFRVCLLADNPFRGALERAVRDDTVDGHPIAVERVPLDGSLAGCQLVFVPRAHIARAAGIARALGTAPVLLVGESDGFLRAGGAINLFVDGGHVRFDVSIGQALVRGLRISSKLLRVARNTGPADPRER